MQLHYLSNPGNTPCTARWICFQELFLDQKNKRAVSSFQSVAAPRCRPREAGSCFPRKTSGAKPSSACQGPASGCEGDNYLLKHECLLLLEQDLELLGSQHLLLEDLLHLLGSDHLRCHHSHRHGNLRRRQSGGQGASPGETGRRGETRAHPEHRGTGRASPATQVPLCRASLHWEFLKDSRMAKPAQICLFLQGAAGSVLSLPKNLSLPRRNSRAQYPVLVGSRPCQDRFLRKLKEGSVTRITAPHSYAILTERPCYDVFTIPYSPSIQMSSILSYYVRYH